MPLLTASIAVRSNCMKMNWADSVVWCQSGTVETDNPRWLGEFEARKDLFEQWDCRVMPETTELPSVAASFNLPESFIINIQVVDPLAGSWCVQGARGLSMPTCAQAGAACCWCVDWGNRLYLGHPCAMCMLQLAGHIHCLCLMFSAHGLGIGSFPKVVEVDFFCQHEIVWKCGELELDDP